MGNRTVKLEGGTRTTYSYDNANQLSVEYTPSARTTYTYDANGNTSAINAAGSRTTYTWDIENHPTLVQLPGGVRNTMTYDGDGKRRHFQESSRDRTLIWDGENIRDEINVGDSLWAVHTLAPRGYGEMIARRAGGVTSFYHFDAVGSTDRMTDSSQDTVISYLYRAFGEETILSGSNSNRFTWVGRLGYYRQTDSDDFWVRARVYRPTTGRWASREAPPVAIRQGSMVEHPYAYCEGNPVSRVDASGLWWKSLHRDWSRTAASVAGFSKKGYDIIAKAAFDIDNFWTLGGLPHFPEGKKTRLQYAADRSKEASDYWDKELCKKAMRSLGRGCHAVQDDTTHPQYPNQHRNWMDNPSHPGNAPKAQAAQHNSKAYLNAFVGSVDKCKCKGYLKK